MKEEEQQQIYPKSPTTENLMAVCSATSLCLSQDVVSALGEQPVVFYFFKQFSLRMANSRLQREHK